MLDGVAGFGVDGLGSRVIRGSALYLKNNNQIEDIEARQICPKIPSISSYQGEFA